MAILRSWRKQGQESAAELAKAIDAYRKSWELDQNAAAGNNLAYALCRQSPANGETACAIVQKLRKSRYSDQPITGDRLDLRILDTLGEAYLASKRPSELIQVITEALARYKNEPMVYLFLGRAYDALGDNRSAYENLNLAILAAEAKADAAKDQSRKDQWKAKAEEARALQQKLQRAKQ
jgi:tetratricopeptide (TPR) repeat protein